MAFIPIFMADNAVIQRLILDFNVKTEERSSFSGLYLFPLYDPLTMATLEPVVIPTTLFSANLNPYERNETVTKLSRDDYLDR